MKLKRRKKDSIETEKTTSETKPKMELPPWKVLIVDDEPDIHAMTRFALDNFKFADKPLQLLKAVSSAEAREVLVAEPDIAVALIDVVMETDNAGLQLIDFIRNELKYSFIRLIIRTGQAGMAPEKEVIERYDIDDYKNKTELRANKLHTTMRMALKSYRALNALEQARQEAEQAHQKANAANQVKSAFLANISHELRTPLNSILGYAQILLQDKGLTVKQQEELSIIQHSGNYLLTLINDILELSEMEQNEIKFCPSDFRLNLFLQDIVKLFQVRAEQKGISFTYQPLSSLPAVIYADEKRLRQILIHLLSNAIKFTKRGGITLRVGSEKLTGKSQLSTSSSFFNFRFQIEDTGTGISAENLEKLFLPFEQESNWLQKSEGAGLGLSLTKKLVEGLRGKLQAESELGKGSKFWVDLVFPEVLDWKDSIPPFIIGYQGPRRKILVIDDHQEIRFMLTEILKPLGFDVCEASNGLDGLNKVHEFKPDLIITDLVMPVMDGFEFIRKIRTLTAFQHLPILADSVSILEGFQTNGGMDLCNGFFSQPIRTKELLELLQKHLNLIWIYEEKGEREIKEEKNLEILEPSSLPASFLKGPSSAEAAKLLDLAKIGDFGGIIEFIAQLEQVDVGLQAFAEQIRLLAKNFDEDNINELVKRYLEEDNTEEPLESDTSVPSVKLPVEQAGLLFHLTMKGDIDGIFEQLDKFEHKDMQLMPVIQKIRQLAEDFKVKEIRELLKQYMD